MQRLSLGSPMSIHLRCATTLVWTARIIPTEAETAGGVPPRRGCDCNDFLCIGQLFAKSQADRSAFRTTHTHDAATSRRVQYEFQRLNFDLWLKSAHLRIA